MAGLGEGCYVDNSSCSDEQNFPGHYNVTIVGERIANELSSAHPETRVLNSWCFVGPNLFGQINVLANRVGRINSALHRIWLFPDGYYLA